MKAFNTDALKAFIKKYVPGKGLVGLNLPDYLDEKARCGCGIDCCEGLIHLVDQDTGTHMVSYISNGDWVTESWAEYQSTGADVVPGCTALNLPLEGADDVCPDAAMTWLAALNAEGYKVDIGTSTGGVQLEDGTDLGAVLTVTPGVGMSAFNPNSTYYVTLIPYSDAGEKAGCTEVSFTTLDVPAATAELTTPGDGTTGIVVDADVTWAAAALATSYLVTIGSSTGLSDIADAVDVGALLTVTPGTTTDIPAQAGATQYFWTITAVNCAGSTDGAEVEFTTA